MLSRTARLVTALCTTVAIVAGGVSVAQATPLEKPKVTGAWELQGTRQMVLDGSVADVVTSVVDHDLVRPGDLDDQWAYARYRVIVRTSGGQITFNRTFRPMRTYFVKMSLTSGRISPSTATFTYQTKPVFTTRTFDDFVNELDALSETEILAKDKAYNQEYNLEDAVLYNSLGDIYDDIRAWSKTHRDARTFSNYPRPLSGLNNGWRYRITGNPNRVFAVTGWPHANDMMTVSLVNIKDGGSYSPAPTASKTTLNALGY